MMGGWDGGGTAPSCLDSLCRSLQTGTRRSHSSLLGGKHQRDLAALELPSETTSGEGTDWQLVGRGLDIRDAPDQQIHDRLHPSCLRRRPRVFQGHCRWTRTFWQPWQHLGHLQVAGPTHCSGSEVQSPVLISCPNAQG